MTIFTSSTPENISELTFLSLPLHLRTLVNLTIFYFSFPLHLSEDISKLDYLYFNIALHLRISVNLTIFYFRRPLHQRTSENLTIFTSASSSPEDINRLDYLYFSLPIHPRTLVNLTISV